jgi:hypothetical protein
MRDITGSNHRRYEQDRTQIETIIRQAMALRAKYLQGNFWPACGTTGGVLLFFVAAVIVCPRERKAAGACCIFFHYFHCLTRSDEAVTAGHRYQN